MWSNRVVKKLKRTYYKDSDKLESEGLFVNGFRDGPHLHFHHDGRLESYMEYKNNERNGICITNNGSHLTYSIMEDDLIHGPYEVCLLSGEKVFTCEYKHGVKHGKYTYYYSESNQPSEVGYYVDGKKGGVSITYYKNGRTRSKTEYVNGEPFGYSPFWYENGTMHSIITYHEGLYHGEFLLFNELGACTSAMLYIDDEITDIFDTYKLSAEEKMYQTCKYGVKWINYSDYNIEYYNNGSHLIVK